MLDPYMWLLMLIMLPLAEVDFPDPFGFDGEIIEKMRRGWRQHLPTKGTRKYLFPRNRGPHKEREQRGCVRWRLAATISTRELLSYSMTHISYRECLIELRKVAKKRKVRVIRK